LHHHQTPAAKQVLLNGLSSPKSDLSKRAKRCGGNRETEGERDRHPRVPAATLRRTSSAEEEVPDERDGDDDRGQTDPGERERDGDRGQPTRMLIQRSHLDGRRSMLSLIHRGSKRLLKRQRRSATARQSRRTNLAGICGSSA
jgi:hypothetical protein